jgi:hypothetical protein
MINHSVPGSRCFNFSFTNILKPRRPQSVGLFFWLRLAVLAALDSGPGEPPAPPPLGGTLLVVAEDANALAASVNPVPMQILSFQHI